MEETPDGAVPRSPRSCWCRGGRLVAIALGFASVLGTYFAFAALCRERAVMNADEGFYAVAARSATEGKLPYRDFAYTQMPLLPYVNGALMRLVGFGLDTQRTINMCWAALALVVAVAALRVRLGRFEPGLFAAWVVAASPHFCASQALGKTHGAAGFFLAACFAAVLWRGPPVARSVACAVFGTLAAGTRLSLGLPVALACIALVFEAKGWRQRALVLAIPLATAGAALLPFVLAAPEAFFFFNLEYHLASVFDRRSVAQLVEWWRCSPGAIVSCFAGLFAIVALVRRRLFTELTLLVAALLAITVPMIPASAYGEYAVSSMLVAAMAGMVALWSVGAMEARPFRHVAWLVPLLVFLHPMPRLVGGPGAGGDVLGFLRASAAQVLPWGAFDQPSEGRTTAAPVEAAAKYLREKVPPGVVLASIPIVAVEADRPVLSGTEMGQFSVMGPKDAARARRLNLTTLSRLTRAVERRIPKAVVKLRGSVNWNFKWRSPSLRRQPKKRYAEFEAALRREYVRAFFAGNIEVLVPRDQPPPPAGT